MLIWLVNTLDRLYMLLILLRVAVSWLDIDRHSRPWFWLFLVTEPALKPFRRFVHLRELRLDFSPLLAVIAIEILRVMLVWILAVAR